MFKIPKLKLILLLITCFLLLSASARTAELNLISQTQEIGISQQFQVDLFLDTENEEINAVEGKIIFPEDLLELKEIRDGNSIVNFWIERPKVKFNNEIDFSGIIPGGYTGEKALIFSIVFQSKKEGEGIVEIREAKALLNDGEGTEVSLSISNFQFSVTHEAPQIGTQIDTKKDTDPPEDFKPEIAQNSDMFDGKYFLVFATQDKGSGIDHYEIYEDLGFRIQDLVKMIKKILYPKSYILNSWSIAESPYLLKDQELRSFIYVKAIDRAGNEKVAVVEPRYPIRWYENYLIWIIIILGVIVLCIIGKILWKKKIVR